MLLLNNISIFLYYDNYYDYIKTKISKQKFINRLSQNLNDNIFIILPCISCINEYLAHFISANSINNLSVRYALLENNLSIPKIDQNGHYFGCQYKKCMSFHLNFQVIQYRIYVIILVQWHLTLSFHFLSTLSSYFLLIV